MTMIDKKYRHKKVYKEREVLGNERDYSGKQSKRRSR